MIKKYEYYKNTPFNWLNKIPYHWILTKNRYGFCKKKTDFNKSEETAVLSLTINGIKIKENLNFGKSTESFIGHQIVEKGDIVFTPRDFDQTPILSDVSDYTGCISNLYIVDKTKKHILINHYVNYYWYGLKYLVDYFKNFSYGMRFSFNRFQFDEIPLLLPPTSEQKQIVKYLDYRTKLIDDLIEKTNQKIELLKEKRTSLINYCVTKGLNPDVEMKDSGVEWIGKIPSNWKVKKIKNILKKDGFRSGPFGSSLITHKLGNSGDYLVYSPEYLTDKIIEYPLFVPAQREDKLLKYLIKEGDIILPIVGTLGRAKLFTKSDKKGILNQRLCKISPDPDKIFILYLLKILTDTQLIKVQIEIEKKGSILDHITKEIIVNLIFTYPPFSEQQQIIEYLNAQTQKIDTLIEKENKRIELLKEYRKSLISEVVTGKIDVREEVIA